MTREEAIEYGTGWLKDEYLDAKDRAFIKTALEVLEQEPCEDCISRQAAIDAIYARYIGGKEAVDKAPANDHYAEGIDEAVCAVEDLPPVTPQQRTGRWIKTRLDDEPDKICDDCGTYCWKCSICGNDASGWGDYKYCPNCGIKMQEVEG